MEPSNIDLNLATFVGIDAHTQSHTALAITRFEEEKGEFEFNNSHEGIRKFLAWLKRINPNQGRLIIGVEGGGNSRHALLSALLGSYLHVYEVNPLFTKQRRSFGTRWDKSDREDARAIAEVLTRKLPELPKISSLGLSANRLVLRKTVWFYEEVTFRGSAIKSQLKELEREHSLSPKGEEKRILGEIIKEKQKDLKRIKDLQRTLRAKLDRLLVLTGEGENLKSIKGVDTVLAAKVVAHSGGISRFQSLDSFIRYGGIAPVEASSGKTKRHFKNARGNRKLNSAFYLLALSQLVWNPKAKDYFEKKVGEGKSKKHALRCLTKRMACIVYGMLKSGENYRG